MPRRMVVIALLLAAGARAATLTTTEGDTLEGDVKKTTNGYAVTAADGKTTTVEARRVKSIELGTSSSDADRAAAALQSLRRSVEYSDDLARIVQRYDAFVAQTKVPAVVAAAKQDAEQWRQRQRDGLVKAGRQWVAPAERDRLTRLAREDAERARLLIKAGHPEAAAKLITDGLTQEPANVSFLYLQGVLAVQRNDFGEARRAFGAVQQALPEHAPTLFNLAVLLLRQHQWGEACGLLDQALAAAPQTQLLLDQTAEFVRLLPAPQTRTTIGLRLGKRFVAQDRQLQAALARDHWYRWGSGWIDQAAHDKIEAESAVQQAKIKALQAEFDGTQQAITRQVQQVRANTDAMQALEQHRYVRAADGTNIRLPLPQSYFDLQDENARLAAQQATSTARLETLRVLARDAQAALPQPTYNGTVTPIGEDGVPLANLPPATSEPTTTEPATTKPAR